MTTRKEEEKEGERGKWREEKWGETEKWTAWQKKGWRASKTGQIQISHSPPQSDHFGLPSSTHQSPFPHSRPISVFPPVSFSVSPHNSTPAAYGAHPHYFFTRSTYPYRPLASIFTWGHTPCAGYLTPVRITSLSLFLCGNR